MTDEERDRLFLQIFTENKHKIYRLIFSYCKDKSLVDDLFQEIMICVWKNLHTFKGESKISTWLFRIAVNNALVFGKKEKKAKSFIKDFDCELIIDVSAEDMERAEADKRKLEKLRFLISSLNEQDRLIITLYLEDLGYKEIADIVGITVSYVGVKITRIKTILEQGMKNNGSK